MNLKLNPDNPKPLHQQAEELLREMISRPEYAQGKLFPSEVELAHNMNISRNTLRQAINKLVFEGLLMRKKGYGTTVAPKSVMSNARNWMSFSQEMVSLGIRVKNFELHVSHKFPDENVATFFGTRTDRRLLCVERLRGSTEMPFVYFVSWFDPRIGMTGEEDFSKPLYEILKLQYGVVVKTSREDVSAKSATAEMADKLEIEPGDAVLVRKRQVYDTDGLSVEYNVGYYRADSFSYSIEFTRE
ncbi:MAG: GntR family transcriptional regulator [Alistipes sp.]|jgi:GntR family transcriptional regulator|nr:GntR family transcriptional regulator [Alistipes sp.]